MVDIALCALASASLIIIFKYLDKFDLDTFPVIVTNYFVCVLVGVMVQGHLPDVVTIASKPWFPLSLVMGVLFILGFNIIGTSTRKAGVTVTAIANKMSLVVPISVAFVLYGDEVNVIKILGILLALASIALTTYTRSEDRQQGQTNTILYALPLGVFLISGVVDSLVNYVQHNYLKGISYSEFFIFLFMTAGTSGLVVLIYALIQKKVRYTGKTLLAGIALGVPNYGSLHFMMRALEHSGMESSVVFPILNIAVVTTAALAALILFKEKLTGNNIAGIAMSIVAILMLAGAM